MSTHAGTPYASPHPGYDSTLTGGAARSLRVSWVGLICVLVAVVMFIPIRRYALPGNLPFELEPYRLLVAGSSSIAAARWVGRRLKSTCPARKSKPPCRSPFRDELDP